jgi:hypothetical protein
MAAFQDFAPRMTDAGGLLRAKEFLSLEETVETASRWCVENGIVPLNVETILLPDIHDDVEQGSTDVHLTTGERGTEWHQVIRVWYLTKSSAIMAP